MVTTWARDGFCVFDHDDTTLAWAQAAYPLAVQVSQNPAMRAANLRHGETWFVGVDALPNDPDGSIADVSLAGRWTEHITRPNIWHPAQLSIIYPGYPKQDRDETDANHRYRMTRKSAHVDGLLPVGADRRRYMHEPHAFILGLPLNVADAAPLVVWPGSHRMMGAAFREAIGGKDPTQVDITDTYHTARRDVFAGIDPVPVPAKPGQAILLHRHMLHGVDIWHPHAAAPPEGRMIAYFRPEFSPGAWIAA